RSTKAPMASRPWIWSDAAWHHPDEFLSRMPKSVVQSNWYYGMDFTEENVAYKTWLLLAENGFDQIPCGSTWIHEKNFPTIVESLSERLGGQHLLGFMQSVWKPMLEECRTTQVHALDMLRQAHSLVP
ncbi:MAG TPA: hypothetical protein PKH07_09120, partial [bacterium]|nr:hypothetical protein [bacterium]